MLSIAILDDNMNMLEEYEKFIPACFNRNRIKGRIVTATADYKDFIREVRDQSANVCIIDINLRAEMNGLYVAKCLRKERIPTEIIFCTGLLEYMPQAFDVNAYNFIVKPVGSNLEKCLIKLNKEMSSRETGRRTLEIKFGSRIYYIPLDSITHIRHVGSKTVIHSANRVLEVYESLESLYRQLNDERFVQCHRAVIVNKEYIDYVDRKNRCLALTNGYTCELGMKYYAQFYVKDRGDSYAV